MFENLEHLPNIDIDFSRKGGFMFYLLFFHVGCCQLN